MAQEWMSVNEAARRLGVAPAVIRYQIIQGQVNSRFTEAGRQVSLGTAGGEKKPAKRGAWWKVTSAAGVALIALGAALMAGTLGADNHGTAEEPGQVTINQVVAE